MQNRGDRTEHRFRLAYDRPHLTGFGDIGDEIAKSHARRGDPFEIGRERRVRVGPGSTDQRKRHAGLAGQAEGTFRGDSLAAPAHEQDIARPEIRTASLLHGPGQESKNGLSSRACLVVVDLRETGDQSCLGDDPLHRSGMIDRHIHHADGEPRFLEGQGARERRRASTVLDHHEPVGPWIVEDRVGRVE